MMNLPGGWLWVDPRCREWLRKRLYNNCFRVTSCGDGSLKDAMGALLDGFLGMLIELSQLPR
jgi:hypothetical protein